MTNRLRLQLGRLRQLALVGAALALTCAPVLVAAPLASAYTIRGNATRGRRGSATTPRE